MAHDRKMQDPNVPAEAAPEAEASPTEAAPAAETATVSLEEAPSSAPADEAVDAAREAAERAAALAEELERLHDRYLRLAAEFDNYRKRIERERAELTTRAQAALLEAFLDVFDDLRRAAATPATSPEALQEAVTLIARKLNRALEAAGVEVLDPAPGTPFDPRWHEAVRAVAASSPEEEGTIAQVYQPGYRLRDYLVRPARVEVRRGESA